MTDELPEEPVLGQEDDDVEFGDVEEMKIQGISQERWDRVRDQVDIRDVIYSLHNRRGNPISCPFHGRDSKPSFNIYPQTNTCFCFGCPDGDGYWDNIKIVSRTMELSKSMALRWIEREFHLEPLAEGASDRAVDLDMDEEEEEEPEIELELEDLAPAYMRYARKLIQDNPTGPDTASLALELIERYFTAEYTNEPIILARVIDKFFGREAIQELVAAKFAKVHHAKAQTHPQAAR